MDALDEQQLPPSDSHLPQSKSADWARWPWLLIGLISAVILLSAADYFELADTTRFVGPIEAIDLEQGRIDTALPAPAANVAIHQSFVPRHDGLSEVEVTLVRYGDATSAETGQLTIQLTDASGTTVAETTLATNRLDHNQPYRLRFERQPHSAGQPYTLTLKGNDTNPFAVWGYSEDVYAGGEAWVDAGVLSAEVPTTAAQDMRFRTRYRLSWIDALQTLGETLYYEGLLLLLALFVLPLPGILLLQVAQRRGVVTGEWDALAWLASAVALGLAAWPLLWQWLTVLGGRFWSWNLWIWVLGGWLAVVVLWLAQRRRPTTLLLRFHSAHLWLLALLLLGAALRLLAVRDVGFPLWVDSSRHALITAVMADSGQAIRSYTPYLPVERFPYHYGFHALAATLRLMSDWPMARLLLYLGQFLNALVPLSLYAAVVLTTRSRVGGLVAAFVIALPSFFPAYYATWGRLTQLTAVILPPIALAWTWQLLHGRDPWRKAWWLLSVLTAGLFLIHFRVFVYFVPFAALAWFVGRFRRTRTLLATGALGALLILPRVWQLWQDTNPANKFREDVNGFNEFPISYFESGLETQFAWLIGLIVVVVLISAVAKRRWAVLPLSLTAWIAALFLLLSGDRLGLPETNLVTWASLYILLFVPGAMLLGISAEGLAHWLQKRGFVWQATALLLTGVLAGGLLLFGLRQQIEILNEQTILARFEDQPALAWVDANLPEDGLIAVNSWRWLGQTWAASDGGAWVVPLTGRLTTAPPIDHIYNPDLWAFVRTFNDTATSVDDWSDPAQATWLQDQGVTHVFVGSRGGFLDPAELSQNPALTLLYQHDGVFVYAVTP